MVGGQIVAGIEVAGSKLGGLSAISGDIIFNGFNLLDCAEIVAEGNYDDINGVQLDTYNAPRTDGGGVLGYYINGKTITFNMLLQRDTEEELNDAIDLLKKNLAVREGLLEITINGLKRQGEANLSSLTFNRDFTKKTIQNNIQVIFVLTNHLYSSEGDAISEVGYTGNALSFDIDNEGTTSCYYKTVFIFGSGNVGVDEISIIKDGYTLTVNEVMSDSDILIIDGVEKEVTLNGNVIDFDGPFTELATGSNPMQITLNGTPNVDITILFNKNYL